jgi:hypothetical protein
MVKGGVSMSEDKKNNNEVEKVKKVMYEKEEEKITINGGSDCCEKAEYKISKKVDE